MDGKRGERRHAESCFDNGVVKASSRSAAESPTKPWTESGERPRSWEVAIILGCANEFEKEPNPAPNPAALSNAERGAAEREGSES